MSPMSRYSIFPALALGLLLAAPAVMAQRPCLDYHKYECNRSGEKRFSINGQSKSAAIQVGQETELNIIVYRGQDYRISVCHDERILGEHLSIRLVEKSRQAREVEEVVTEVEPVLDANGEPTGATREVKRTVRKRVFEDVQKVLWDNASYDMAQEVEFSCTATKRLAIQIMAPGGDGGRSRKNDPAFDIGCCGILVEHMATPGLGFK
jgi:hypothetical protein